jgi:hypothetical protein
MSLTNAEEFFYYPWCSVRQTLMEMQSLKGPQFIRWMTDDFAALVEG